VRRRESARAVRPAERPETRAKEVAAAHPEPYTICFVFMDHEVVNRLKSDRGSQQVLPPPPIISGKSVYDIRQSGFRPDGRRFTETS
jgi:hypothetical protein